VMPIPPSQEAWEWARKLLAGLIIRNSPDIHQPLYEAAAASGELENLGHYLAMEAMGHGVAWSDDHDPHGLDVPDQESIYYYSEEDYE